MKMIYDLKSVACNPQQTVLVVFAIEALQECLMVGIIFEVLLEVAPQ